jgi:hypothetical protein
MDVQDFLDGLFLGGSTYMFDEATGRTNDPSDYPDENADEE